MKEYREQLLETLAELGDDSSLAPVVRDLDVQENPEMKFEYTRDSLLKFKAEYDRRQALERQNKAAQGGGGFGNFGSGGAAAAEKEAEQTEAYVTFVRNIRQELNIFRFQRCS